MNKKITKSNSESFLYSKIKKDNVYESFKRKIVKTAKIDLREEKCDNKKDIEEDILDKINYLYHVKLN